MEFQFVTQSMGKVLKMVIGKKAKFSFRTKAQGKRNFSPEPLLESRHPLRNKKTTDRSLTTFILLSSNSYDVLV